MLSWDSNEKIIKVFQKHKNLCDVYVAVYWWRMYERVRVQWLDLCISVHFQFILYGIMLGVEILTVVQGKRVANGKTFCKWEVLVDRNVTKT